MAVCLGGEGEQADAVAGILSAPDWAGKEKVNAPRIVAIKAAKDEAGV